MMINLPDEVKYILKKLNQNSFEGFVVGGCVRDILVGRDVSDWDITTDALPDDVIRIFREEKKYLNGIKHGTVAVNINDKVFEITTYRIDGHYKDFRRPDSISFSTSLVEDLKRRDFTINAMAYNESSGLIDVYGGKNDIEDKVIRCVGNADERFREDALRILRAIRFTSQLGFHLDCKTENAIIKNAYLIENISKERMRDEIIKIITSNNPDKICTFLAYGILNYMIPKTILLNNIIFAEESQKNCLLGDTLINMETNLGLRLALLLHEIEGHISDKVICGICCNEEVLSSICGSILESLRFDKKTISKVKMLIRYHDTELSEDQKSIRLWLSRIGSYNLEDLIRFKQVLKNSLNAACVPENSGSIDVINHNLECVLRNGDCFEKVNLALNGDDIKKMGYDEGRNIGRIIDMLLNVVIEDPYMNTKENLIKYLLEINNLKSLKE